MARSAPTAAASAPSAPCSTWRQQHDRTRHHPTARPRPAHRPRFGEGEYRYFGHPLPEPVVGLKQAIYPRLLPITRDWWTKLRRDTPWPDDFDEWLARCHAAGQSRTTPILLKYGQGDWNAPPRDLYGDLVFTTRDRPVESVRGWSAGQVRHGVSLIRSGTRMSLALPFHDAG